jgi:hypothetical protein
MGNQQAGEEPITKFYAVSGHISIGAQLFRSISKGKTILGKTTRKFLNYQRGFLIRVELNFCFLQRAHL